MNSIDLKWAILTGFIDIGKRWFPKSSLMVFKDETLREELLPEINGKHQGAWKPLIKR